MSVALGCGGTSPPGTRTLSTSGAPSRKTAVLRYTAFARSGEIRNGLTVSVSHAVADCDLSYRTKGAMRCFLGDEIRDPCYAEGHGPQTRSVVCVNSPWDRSVTRARTPLGFIAQASQVDAPGPWAIELVGGFRCTGLGGATIAIGDRRMNYGCWLPGKPKSMADLFGEPDRRHAQWTIYVARDGDVRSMRRAAIKTVWR